MKESVPNLIPKTVPYFKPIIFLLITNWYQNGNHFMWLSAQRKNVDSFINVKLDVIRCIPG